MKVLQKSFALFTLLLGFVCCPPVFADPASAKIDTSTPAPEGSLTPEQTPSFTVPEQAEPAKTATPAPASTTAGTPATH